LRRLVVAQQADAKRLAEQVGGLTGAIDTLRQSFASTQASDSSEAPAARRAQVRSESRATRGHRAGVYRKRSKS
jgi:hypothetical protein